MPRPKGSRNQATIEREKAVKEGGMTPLEYLLSVFRDEDQDGKDRLDAAKAAAPYVHPRLASVEMNSIGGPLYTVTLTEQDYRVLSSELDTEYRREADKAAKSH